MLASSFTSLDTMSLSMAPSQQDHTAQVAEKVMRRIEIAKVARNLHDCLAFASFKAQNGWQDRTLSTIEPEVTEKLARRKRPCPADLHTDDTFSFSERASIPSSSQPLPSTNSVQSYPQSRKRIRASSSSATLRADFQPAGLKPYQSFPQHSPVFERPDTAGTLPSLQDSPMFDAPSASDDEDQDVGLPYMEHPTSSVISTSPPRTPPPAGRRHLTNTKQIGADTMLYPIDTPRTPAIHIQEISSSTKNPPSTPPYQHANLPSSVMRTPGTVGLFNGALNTPGNFNLAEFCNVTPSPADIPLIYTGYDNGRTPSRTARRGLNFDNLMPPSPVTQRKQHQGLALQLGDALDR